VEAEAGWEAEEKVVVDSVVEEVDWEEEGEEAEAKAATAVAGKEGMAAATEAEAKGRRCPARCR
jgi:hypothetical protein